VPLSVPDNQIHPKKDGRSAGPQPITKALWTCKELASKYGAAQDKDKRDQSLGNCFMRQLPVEFF
jgi:hypothetical protein